MAYHSFGGEVEASNTPTIRRFILARRHQLSRISLFIYGFAKNERDNIDEHKLATLKDLAAAWMSSNESVQRDHKIGLLLEVKDEYEQKKT
jgi:hypothetical protein